MAVQNNEHSDHGGAEEELASVGARVAALRDLYGLSQRELARRVGLTNATISQIEQNLVSPTVATLKKVASGFGLTLAEFFSPRVDQPRRFFYPHATLRELGAGGVSLRSVAADDSYRAMQVLHERYEPGADTGPETLSHAGEESGVVVRGHVTVTIGAQTRVLGPGDAYYFPSRIPHRFHNDGTELVEIVSAATPPSF